MHACQFFSAGCIDPPQQGACPLAVENCGVQHVGHGQIAGINSSAVHLGWGVYPYQRLANLAKIHVRSAGTGAFDLAHGAVPCCWRAWAAAWMAEKIRV